MRTLVSVFVSSLLVACTWSGFGSTAGQRVATSPCHSTVVPWLLDDVAPTDTSAEYGTALRVATYNIHAGLGRSWAMRRSRATVERNLDAIADVLAQSSPEPLDLIALNEVDFPARRSGNIDQASYLAEALKRRTGAAYEVAYGQTRERNLPLMQGRYGNAVLVRHNILKSNACMYDDAAACEVAPAEAGMPPLRAPGLINRLTREARGAIKLSFVIHGHPVDAIVTHLDAFVMPEREAQASHLLRRFVDGRRTTLLLGDVNAVPAVMTHKRAFFQADRTHDILTSGSLADARVLYDAVRQRADFSAWATYPVDQPKWPLDAVLGSLDLMPTDVRVIGGHDSDHLGLYVEYRFASDMAVVQQHARHAKIRERQLARLISCEVPGETRDAKLAWLRNATSFLDLPVDTAALIPEVTP